MAAISGALGLGLVIMALEVSLRRKNADAALPRVLDNARELLTLLARDADEDVAVFEQFMAALALPKSSEAEQHRRAALREAALAASRSPLAAAGRLVTALELAEQSAPLVARSIVSDVGAGAALLGGALRATLLSVDINLGQVDEDQRRALAGAREALAVRAQALEQVVAQRVQSRLT
ncbi:cyclodeaminase/cyclohydrolase family protein [Deinococcus peraridilitoris]|uniref:cyclodeaminase/cyclohydrolase family protein n=1 Tax=Deinococcus peraridilitoris TaxID=432329 RepID=UPI0002FE53A4|nr:cyclodeaminase/cyclohydrolase family protein [Deinococcus peraridilitoris]